MRKNRKNGLWNNFVILVMVILVYKSSSNCFEIPSKDSEQNLIKPFDRDKFHLESDLDLKRHRLGQINEIFDEVDNSLSTIETTQQSSSFYDESFGFSEGTHFRTRNLTDIITQVGSIVEIPCRVHNLGENTVSWIRKKDYHLLTVGSTTYSSDLRFSSMHKKESLDWPLKIKYVQLHDASVYECQISTHPPTSLLTILNVVEARAEIIGPQEKYLKPGSTLRLTCKVVDNIENPIYIFWYHNSRMINYDAHRGVNVSTASDNKFSELTIAQATTNFTGSYLCSPSNAISTSTFVHIFNGENPAAILGDNGSQVVLSNFMKLYLVAAVTYQMVL